METTPIDFKQRRDFGDVFNATFAFIRQEIKPLGKAFIYYVLPFLIISAILSVLVGIEQQKSLNAIKAGDIDLETNPFAIMGPTYKYAFLSVLVSLFAMSALSCTIFGYIKLYVTKGKDQFTLADVWAEVKRFMFPVIGASLVVGLITGIGFIFCIVPGIWLGVSLSLTILILVYEENGFSYSLSRSFNLTREDWWITFAIILVSYIIVYLVSLLLSIPAIVMGMKSLFSAFKESQDGPGMNFSTTFYIMNSVTQLIEYIIISIPLIAIAFQYFNLLEKTEKTSLNEKIEQIG